MIEPYYETSLGKLYNGDALEIMQELDIKADLCLTDPPYGNNFDYNLYNDTEENLKCLINNVVPLILDKTERALITCGVNNIGLYPKPKWILNWVSTAGTGSGPWGFCCWQPILAYGKDPYLQERKGRRPDIFLSNETSEKNGHACPKPIKLWVDILLRGSVNENDLILDPFFGSGTSGVACELMGRKWIGIELDESYCEIAANRIRKLRCEPISNTSNKEGLFNF